MKTIEEIRQALDSNIYAMQSNVIKTGKIPSHDGRQVDYELHYGWDVVRCRACDREWGEYNLALGKFIDDQKYDEATLQTVLQAIQVDDDHWEWMIKSGCYKTDEYHWFFLTAEGKQQAACLIYHPKKSAVEDKNIYYIEFIAAAPWNRGNPMDPKLLKGVGSLVIKSIIEFATTKLGFSYGFSLHALPRASGFYTKIGMKDYPHLDKGGLQYFEMAEEISVAYVEAA